VGHRRQTDLEEGHDPRTHGQQPDAEPEGIAGGTVRVGFGRPGVGVQGGGNRAVGGTVHGADRDDSRTRAPNRAWRTRARSWHR